MEHDALFRKIQALMVLSERGGTEGEAQAAAAQLERLLAKHNLDIADLEKRGKAKAPGIREHNHDLGKAAFNWKLDLAEEIAEHYFCHPLIDRRLKTVVFIGRPDNVESLQMLYGWLIDQIRRLSTSTRKEHIATTGNHIDPLRWQVSFGEGAAKRLGQRLRELRRKQSDEAGTALVLSRKAEISDWMEDKFGYRVDGRMTKRQQEAEKRWEETKERYRKELERRAKLLEEDPEAYYREFPDETPEAKAKAAEEGRKAREEEAKRKERNARRRKGPAWRPKSAEEYRKEEEQLIARGIGVKAADRINLQPFVTGRTDDDQRKLG